MKVIFIGCSILVFLVPACSADATDDIVGTWYEVGANECMRLFKDGSIQVYGDLQLSGAYSFPEAGYIRVDLGGIGALAGPQIVSYIIDGDKLAFTKPDGDIDKYVRNSIDPDEGCELSKHSGFVEDDQITKAKADIDNLENALKFYRLDTFAYPSSEQGLDALVTKPADSNVQNWKAGGYLSRVPNDPWGNPYLYLNPGDKGEIDIYTLGADGRPGGSGLDQDIGNWQLR